MTAILHYGRAVHAVLPFLKQPKNLRKTHFFSQGHFVHILFKYAHQNIATNPIPLDVIRQWAVDQQPRLKILENWNYILETILAYENSAIEQSLKKLAHRDETLFTPDIILFKQNRFVVVEIKTTSFEAEDFLLSESYKKLVKQVNFGAKVLRREFNDKYEVVGRGLIFRNQLESPAEPYWIDIPLHDKLPI